MCTHHAHRDFIACNSIGYTNIHFAPLPPQIVSRYGQKHYRFTRLSFYLRWILARAISLWIPSSYKVGAAAFKGSIDDRSMFHRGFHLFVVVYSSWELCALPQSRLVCARLQDSFVSKTRFNLFRGQQYAILFGFVASFFVFLFLLASFVISCIVFPFP